jgi:hypothetical protein
VFLEVERKGKTMEPRVLHKERTSWSWWVHLLIWGGVAIAAGAGLSNVRGFSDPDFLPTMATPIGIAALIPLFFYGLFGYLSAQVTEAGIRLKWGPLGWIKKFIPFDTITKAEAVTYSPLMEFGGWGIRMRGKKRAWTVRGNRAVRMELTDGKIFYLGSERPERFAEWIRSMERKKEA